MCRLFGLFVFLLLLPWLVRAQSAQEDSLRRVARTAAHDTTRAYAWWMMSYLAESNDSTVRYARQALRLMERLEPALPDRHLKARWQTLRAATYTNLAVGYGNLGQTALVEPYYLRALRIHERLGNHENVASTLNNLGVQASIVGDFHRALDYLQRALRIARTLKGKGGRVAKERTGSCLVDLSVLYSRQGDYPTALRYARQAVAELRQTDSHDGHATALYRVASWALKLGDTLQARSAARQCLTIAGKAGSQRARRNAADVLGQLALKQQRIGQARTWHQQALRIDRELGMKVLQANDLTSLARVEQAAGRLPLALDYARQAAQAASAAQNIISAHAAEALLGELYAALGDEHQALAHYRRYIVLHDSVRNQDNEKAALQQRLSYEYEKKESALRADQEKRQAVARAEIRRQKLLRNGFIGGAILLLVLALVLWQRFLFQRRTTAIIAREKQRSEELLLNILPAETAQELKETGHARARQHELVTVLFADVVNFTQVAEQLRPEVLVDALDAYFAAFDRLSERFSLEKIKTIGDAYLVAGGLNGRPADAPTAVVRCALAMQDAIGELNSQRAAREEPTFVWRMGIHTGPVVAGVVGIKKFAYDIWGDTVNTAARMEQNSLGGHINISQATWERVHDWFVCTPRGHVAAKNKGEIAMYFVERELEAAPAMA